MEEAILGVVTAALTAAVTFIRQWITANIKPRQLQTALDVTRTVVAAAEKIGDEFSVGGKEKYDFAKSVLQSTAKKVGVNLSDGEAMAFIHAVLKEIDDLGEVESYGYPVTDPGAAA